MNPKYLILYIVAGSIGLILVAYQLIATNPADNIGRLILNAIIALFFYYLAYKTYHEKKDRELM